MFEATFYIQGQVAYSDITSSRDVSIELWCNDHCDLLHVRGEIDGSISERVSEKGGVKNSLRQDDEEIIITMECLKPHIENNIEAYLEKHDCLLLPPLRYEDGGKIVRVLALESEHLTRFYLDIQENFQVTVRMKQQVDDISHDSMFSLQSYLPGLSDRQRETLINAWEKGYYNIPRDTSTEELAEGLGIDRRTFEEHLRIAEKKIVETIIEKGYR